MSKYEKYESLVNMSKSADVFGFIHIYYRNI